MNIDLLAYWRRERQQYIARRYRLTRSLSRSTHAEIFLAYDRRRKVDVVVKHYLTDNADQRQRLLASAKEQQQLNHPHLVPIIDAGLDPTYGVYWVMPWIEGPTLDVWSAQHGPMHPKKALLLAERIAQAAAALAAIGIVHGDIKPENVLLAHGNCETPCLIDCGNLAILTEHTSGPTIGTPAYMAPEVIQTSRLSIAGDIYAWGVLLFGLLCGESPFRRETRAATLMAHVYDPIPALRTEWLGSAAGRALNALLQQCLAKRARQRLTCWLSVLAELKTLNDYPHAVWDRHVTGPAEMSTRVWHPTPQAYPRRAIAQPSPATMEPRRLIAQKNKWYQWPLWRWQSGLVSASTLMFILLNFNHHLGISAEAPTKPVQKHISVEVHTAPADAMVLLGNRLLCSRTPCQVSLDVNRSAPTQPEVLRILHQGREAYRQAWPTTPEYVKLSLSLHVPTPFAQVGAMKKKLGSYQQQSQ
jgi:serine/threonine-protein kinase